MLNRLVLVAMTAFAISAIAAPPTTQKTPDQLFQEVRQKLQQEQEQSLKDLPELGEQKITDLMALKREGNLLQLIPLLQPTNEPVRFTMASKNVIGRADFRSANDQRNHVVTAQIEMIDFSKPGDLQRSSSFFVAPTTLNISTMAQRTVGEFSVQYLQSRDGDEMAVKLLFQEDSDFTNQDRSITCEARSFTELRQKYGREVQQYLAPILRDAGFEQAAFAPPLPIAQQALGVGAEIDSAAVDSIEPLLAKLESPDFRTRHKASQELQKLSRAKVLALARADRKNWSLDRIAAVDALLATADIPSTAEVSTMSADPIFLIDCLYLDDLAVRKEAAVRLESLAKLPLKINAEESLEQRVLTIDRLVNQLVPPMRIEGEPEK